MGEDNEEVFFSLEDDVPVASSRPTKAAPVAKRRKQSSKMLRFLMLKSSCKQRVIMRSIALIGMDCPDCASKATKALNFMPQVSTPVVSATSGEVKLPSISKKDHFRKYRVSFDRLVMPRYEHHHLKGVKAANVAKRNNTTLRELKKLFRLQPGVLDADIEKDGRILLQMVTSGDQNFLPSVMKPSKRYVALNHAM